MIVGVFLLGAIASSGSDDDETEQVSIDPVQQVTSENKDQESKEKDSKVEEAPKIKTYKDGTYLVGKDIAAGLYKVILTDNIIKMGYIERAKDVTLDFDSIIANILLTGDGYVEIKDTDVAVKLQGVEIYLVDISKLEKDLKTEISDGIFLVGIDISPGTYKVEVTDNVSGMAYVERAKNVSMGFDDIIANELFQGQGYVKVLEGDFAVKVQGAKLILQ